MEAQLAQLEVLTDQNMSDERATIFELCTSNDKQLETSFIDAGSANSNCSEIRTKTRVNSSQICHYLNRL